MRLLAQHLRPAAAALLLGMGASLLLTLLRMAFTQVIRFTVDGVLLGDGSGLPAFAATLSPGTQLAAACALAAAIALLQFGVSYIQDSRLPMGSERFVKSLRDALYSRIQRLPYSWHVQNSTGDIIQRCISDVEIVRAFVMDQLLELLGTLFMIVTCVVIMFTMNVKMALLATAFVPVIVGYSILFYHFVSAKFVKADEAEGALSAVVPALLEKNGFEQVWSDAWWYKLKHGCAAYGVFWDPQRENGLGDVALRRLDLLNLFWEPGITDLQESRNLFLCALVPNDDINAAYPGVQPGNCGVELAQYLYDDAVDTTDMSIVVDWYYKKRLPDGRTVLHLIKFTGDSLLYASENDPAMADGFYAHGRYPVVFDVMYPEAGTPCGFGMIAVSKDPQQYIDRLSGNLLEMSMKAARPRFWVKKGSGVNVQEFLDWSNPLVEVEGSIDEERLRQISLYNMDSQWVNVLQLKINELKETSNSRDVNQGGVTGGVTAASAIAALQEAGSKSSRDVIRASYRAFVQVVELMIASFTPRRARSAWPCPARRGTPSRTTPTPGCARTRPARTQTARRFAAWRRSTCPSTRRSKAPTPPRRKTSWQSSSISSACSTRRARSRRCRCWR